jgi:hypothetical protein
MIEGAKQALAHAKKKEPAVQPRKRRRANNAGVQEIPTIERSTLRSSIAEVPAGALISKIICEARVLVHHPSDFIVVDEDREHIYGTFTTVERAIEQAKCEGKEYIDNNDTDCTIFVYQLVAKVDCEKPSDVISTVSMIGNSPA